MESLDIIYLNQFDRIYPKNNSLFSQGDIYIIYIKRKDSYNLYDNLVEHVLWLIKFYTYPMYFFTLLKSWLFFFFFLISLASITRATNISMYNRKMCQIYTFKSQNYPH